MPVLELASEPEADAAAVRQVRPALELSPLTGLELGPVGSRLDGGAGPRETARAQDSSILDRDHHGQDADPHCYDSLQHRGVPFSGAGRAALGRDTYRQPRRVPL